MNHLATIIDSLEQAGVDKDVLFQVNTMLAPVSPLFPLTNLYRLIDSLSSNFIEEVEMVRESVADSLAPLSRTDPHRQKIEKAVDWLAHVAKYISEDGHHIEAIRSGWYESIAKVVKGLINEIKGNPTLCLARTFKCRECGSMDEREVCCSICGGIVRPCLGRVKSNGRCEFHGGNDVNEKGDSTLSLQRQLLVKSDSRRRTLDKIHNSPDLLNNTADIEVLELRQQELFESLGDFDLYELREGLRKKIKQLKKTIAAGGADEAEAMLDDIVFNAHNDDKIWNQIASGANLLAILREKEHKRIIAASEIMTREMFEINLVKFRDAVLRGIQNVSRQLPMVMIGELTSSSNGDDYIAQKLPLLLPANTDTKVERFIKEAVFKELSGVQ